MEELTLEAKEARKDYKRRYRIRNREKASAKVKNIRASWEEYGITPERLNELIGIVRSGKYDAVVLSAAREADESAAGHIIMSVKENVSYDALEARQASGKIERVVLGRSDFYGARRLFFHYLDCELRNRSDTELKNVKEG